MGIDGKSVDASPRAGIDRPCSQRPMKQRHQRLGQMVGEGAQTGPETRAEYESLIHAPRVTAARPQFKPAAGNCFLMPPFPGVSILPNFIIMKTILITSLSAVAALSLSNCAAPSGPNTQRGMATGALLGAAAGGIIGHQSGRGLEGAAIGAAGGGTAGALYGNARDQEQYGRY
jgi:hypothetical protein